VSQSLPFGEVRRGFPFNAFNCMKAYSFNGERYGYYGYDDAGQRMYKVTLNNTLSRINALGDNVLEVEKLMLYPNGYININQNGEYTKHYYVEEARIASKIGSGYEPSITTGTDSLKMLEALEVMQKELGEVTNDTIENISRDFVQITHLQGDSCKYEEGLYFYHGNHLSSTQLITDMYGSVTQAVLYGPWGNIISEYRLDWLLDTIPRYLFSGKEKDEESGMYYFEARYYSDEDIVFRGRDIAFEEYPATSPYCAFANNPVKYIDPDGRKLKLANNFAGAMKNIAMIAATNRGQGVVDRLISRNQTYTFTSTFFSRSSTYNPNNRTASYVGNPWRSTVPVDGGSFNSMIAMAHEMFHGYDQSFSQYTDPSKFGAGKYQLEPRAVSFENYMRQAYGMSPLRNKYGNMDGNFNQYNNPTERITNFTELGGNQDGTSYGFSYTKTITVPMKMGEGEATSTSQQQYMIVSRDKDNNVSYKIYNNEQEYNDATKDW